MIKKTITYKDLDDNDVTETFEFHLSRAEMAEMALAKEGKAGGFDVWVRTLINSQDGEVLTQTFKQILLSTVGKRSDDNRRFVKNDEIRNNFLHSDAYSMLFMELMTDAEKVSEFINGVVPTNMRDETQKNIQQAVQDGTVPALNGPQAQVAEKAAPTEPTVSPQTPSGAGSANPAQPKDERPEWLKAGRVPTEAELKGASQEHILEAFKLRQQQ